MRRLLKIALLGTLMLTVAGAQALNSRQRAKLEALQSAYAAAIRWGDFEKAWDMVDPVYRTSNPMSDLAFRRYEQVQISGYRDLNSAVEPDGTVTRTIEVRVINKHTQAERSLRYRERWRWDAEGKRWWLVAGLPDLWDGE